MSSALHDRQKRFIIKLGYNQPNPTIRKSREKKEKKQNNFALKTCHANSPEIQDSLSQEWESKRIGHWRAPFNPEKF